VKPSYEDIKKRIDEEPKWYDNYGVPRYEEFNPELTSNIYADEIALLEIRCQWCGKKFLVEIHRDAVDVMVYKFSTLEKLIKNKTIHYGDPPYHDCVGDTMNCEDIRVIQYWKKENAEWKRVKELEVELEVENE